MVGRRDFRAAHVVEKFFFSPVVRASITRGPEKNLWREPTVTPSSFTVIDEELHHQA